MKLKRKTKFRILILLLVLLSFKVIYHKYLSSEAYIKKTTGIYLPFWTTANQTATTEVAVIGKFQIPESKVEEFISKNKLKKATDIKDIKIGFYYILKEKNRPNNKINGNWFLIDDCKPGNAWRILLNSESNDLWILVRFPDWSGDGPDCNKNKV
ncbi:hypothetical protein [Winogradskyella ouciana]|uniref:hypothetical protein n=1 Tax=Winogradskyella ouciana TaxID=2608631 RepID=UPI003D298F94